MKNNDLLDDLIRQDLAHGVKAPEDLNQKILAQVEKRQKKPWKTKGLGLIFLSSGSWLLSLSLVSYLLWPYLGRFSLPLTLYYFVTSLASTLVLALVLLSERRSSSCIWQI